jgi:hypothetical protein
MGFNYCHCAQVSEKARKAMLLALQATSRGSSRPATLWPLIETCTLEALTKSENQTDLWRRFFSKGPFHCRRTGSVEETYRKRLTCHSKGDEGGKVPPVSLPANSCG